ncbi:MAG TPA: hypothetical protein VLH37_02805 [Bacteroidales bacterium]|nr:hypothetical protein [Bacteroidales bacterium]
MKNYPALIFFAVFALLLLTNCNNNENLILGQWEMELSVINGVKQDNEPALTWTVIKNGSFRQVMGFPHGTEELTGVWSIDENANTLLMVYTETQTEVLWAIVKLEGDLLEVTHTRPGFIVERRFKRIS